MISIKINVIASILIILGIILTALIPLALFGSGLFLIGLGYVVYLHGKINVLEKNK